MLNKFLNIRNCSFTVLFTSLIKFSSLFKVSFVVGSAAAFFSATPLLQPLAGVWGGILGSAMVFCASAALRMFIGGGLHSYF